MADRYWVGGTASWTATAGLNWSTTSGGVGGASNPGTGDRAIFDANSGAVTVTVSATRACGSIDFTGFTGTFTGTSTPILQVNGAALTLSSTMTLGLITFQTLLAGTTTVTWAGKLMGALTCAASNTVSQADAMLVNGAFTANGSWTTNDFTATISTLSSANSNVRTFNLGASTINLTSVNATTVWNVTGTNLTLNAGTSNIVLVNSAVGTRTFAGGGKTYGGLTYAVTPSPGVLAITGANTFAELNVDPGRTLTLPASTTTTVTDPQVGPGADWGYLYLPGNNSGNYVSTPDAAPLQVTGDIDIRVWAAADAWASGTRMLISKRTAGTASTISYSLEMLGSGLLEFSFSNGTTAVFRASSVAPTVANGSDIWLRATRVAASGLITFYTSPDGTNWTQLGTTFTQATGAIRAGTEAVEVGSMNSGTNTFLGKLYRAQIRNGINGTVVFDADLTAKPVGADTFVESSSNGATVTINGPLARNGDGRLTVNSSSAGTAATLSSASGRCQSDYLVVTDIAVTGGADWYAGHNSVDVSGNSGWIWADYFAAAVELLAAAALDADGSTAATYTGAVELLAPGALDAAAVRTTFGAADLLAAAALDVAATRTALAAVDLLAPGALDVAAVRTTFGAVDLTAPGALDAAAVRTALAAAELLAPGVLTVDAIRTTFGAVDLLAPGALDAAGTRTTPGAVELLAAAVLDAAAVRATFGAVELLAPGALDAAGLRTTFGAVDLLAPGALDVSALRATFAAAELTAPGALDAAAVRATFAAADLTAPGALDAAATRTALAAAELLAPGALTSDAVRTALAAVDLLAPGALTGDASGAALYTGAAELLAPGALDTAAGRTTFAAALLTAPGALDAAAVRTAIAAAELTAPGALDAASLRQTAAAVELLAAAALLTAGTVQNAYQGAVDLLAPGALDSAGVRLTAAAVLLTAPGALSGAALPVRLAAVELLAPGWLDVGALILGGTTALRRAAGAVRASALPAGRAGATRPARGATRAVRATAGSVGGVRAYAGTAATRPPYSPSAESLDGG